MDEQQLHADFLVCLDKNEVRGDHADKIMNWLNVRLTDIAIISNVNIGHMEVTGWDEESESPLFKLTESGKEHARKLTEGT